MTALKRNRSPRKVGHGRGVPIRLARAIAKKYSLSHIVLFTVDTQQRARGIYWARNSLAGMQCASFCQKAEGELGWESVGDWDSSSVRRLKDRIKELELACAEIVDHAPGSDAIAIARKAGRFPDESL
jgi:hypothetical protein